MNLKYLLKKKLCCSFHVFHCMIYLSKRISLTM